MKKQMGKMLIGFAILLAASLAAQAQYIYTTLDVPGASSTQALGISGTNIVGVYVGSSGALGFYFNGSSYTTLDVPGAAETVAYGISGNNTVGQYEDSNSSNVHGFLFNGSTYASLDVPGAIDTYANGISGNNIVGQYEDSSSNVHGFLLSGSTYTTLDVPGAVWTEADGISGSNIVGDYRDTNGVVYGFMALCETVTVTPSRVPFPAADVSPTDSIDAPIVPVTDTNLLSEAPPLGVGVVADGVTPVLFQISGSSNSDYTISISNYPASFDGVLASNLYVLHGGSWEQSTNLVIDSSGLGFAYLSGLNWNDFIAPPSSNEITLTFTVTDNSSETNSVSFEVRPPPIILVHGYNADSNTWSASFLNVLRASVPADFVQPIQYGVTYQTNIENAPHAAYTITNIFEDKSDNTSGNLIPLAKELDGVLNQAFAVWTNDWACTRYDVVAHSQGGVLVRMLCQTNLSGGGAFVPTPVVSANNFYRGRFRRIITIGSPQNGSLLLSYILDMEHSFNPWVHLIPLALSSLAQGKFDPFGSQITNINNRAAYPIDARIKFNCIQTTIAQPQSLLSGPPCYFILGLDLKADTLLPDGSDGVVDFASQGGGLGTTDTNISGTYIAHADYPLGPLHLFGVPAGQSDTTYPKVAEVVTNLLRGKSSAFGSFILPANLPPSEAMLVDSLVPAISLQDLILQTIMPLNVSSNYNYTLQQPSGVGGGGTVTWFVQVFGTNGISEDDVSLQVATNNPSAVTVSVANSLQGTVVLYASYSTTNGSNLVFATPVVVVSHPVGAVLSGITLVPANATLRVGDTQATQIWGDYTNGASSLLYVPSGGASYASSDTNIASVDTNGTITVHGPGSATIAVTYNGFSAQAAITVPNPIPPKPVITKAGENVSISFATQTNVTYYVESKTNLTDASWIPLQTFSGTGGIITFTTTNSVNTQFFRIETY